MNNKAHWIVYADGCDHEIFYLRTSAVQRAKDLAAKGQRPVYIARVCMAAYPPQKEVHVVDLDATEEDDE